MIKKHLIIRKTDKQLRAIANPPADPDFRSVMTELFAEELLELRQALRPFAKLCDFGDQKPETKFQRHVLSACRALERRAWRIRKS